MHNTIEKSKWGIIIIIEMYIIFLIYNSSFYGVNMDKYQGYSISNWSITKGEDTEVQEQIPCHVQSGENEKITLEVSLNEVDLNNNVLLLQIDPAFVQAYVDNTLIYSSQEDKQYAYTSYHTENWTEISIPVSDKLQNLRIEVVPMSWNNAMSIHESFLTDQATANAILVSNAGINIVISTMVMLGLLVVMLLCLACELVRGGSIVSYMMLAIMQSGIVNVANYFSSNHENELYMLEQYWIVITSITVIFLYLRYVYNDGLQQYVVCRYIIKGISYIIAINYTLFLVQYVHTNWLVITSCISIAITSLVTCIVWIKEKRQNRMQIISVAGILFIALIDIYKMLNGDWVLAGIMTNISIGCSVFVICFANLIKLVKVESVSISRKEENINYKIALMQSQIKPHFLYNTLNSISWLCKSNPQKADEAIIRFSRFLRTNMKSLDEIELISFEKELEHIDNYIQLEKLRFPQVRIEYDLEYRQFKIPSLTLQPLVENAIKHGISGMEMDGVIIVSSRLLDNYIELKIQDNGLGYDMANHYEKKSTGIRNVKNRLELCCNARFVIESVMGEGTVITITIPLYTSRGEIYENYIR